MDQEKGNVVAIFSSRLISWTIQCGPKPLVISHLPSRGDVLLVTFLKDTVLYLSRENVFFV